MKRKLVQSLVIAIMISFIQVPAGEASAATDLGAKVAEKIITSIAGEGAGKLMSLIIGGNENPLTIQQVEGAINSAFNKAAIKEINGDVNGLVNMVNDYVPSRDTLFVQDLITATGYIKGDIDAQISAENSHVLIPHFLNIWNTRLSFAAERYRRTQEADDKSLIAQIAIDGLKSLEGYLTNDFADPKRNDWPCIKKAPETQLSLNGGVGTNWSEKSVDVSTQYCYGNGRVLKENVRTVFGRHIHVTSKETAQLASMGVYDDSVVNLGGAWYMHNIGIGRTRWDHQYMFAHRLDSRGKEYFLQKTPNKWFAEWLRNHYTLKFYPRELGDLHSQVLAWVDIAKASGSQWQLRQAWIVAMKLGVGWNTLEQRYGAGVKDDLSLFTALFKHDGENREIFD